MIAALLATLALAGPPCPPAHRCAIGPPIAAAIAARHPAPTHPRGLPRRPPREESKA